MIELCFRRDPEDGSSRRPLVRLHHHALRIVAKQRQHWLSPGDADNLLAQLRIEEEAMGNAGHALEREHFGGGRFVVGQAVRDGAVEADVVAEREVALLAPAHREQPAIGADIERDAMVRAIALDRLDDDPLAARHVSLSPVAVASSSRSWRQKPEESGKRRQPEENQSYS